MRWGATPAEAAAPLPGDHLVGNACLQFTRAITALGLALRVLMEPIQLLMERKMLLGMRDRAQRT